MPILSASEIRDASPDLIRTELKRKGSRHPSMNVENFPSICASMILYLSSFDLVPPECPSEEAASLCFQFILKSTSTAQSFFCNRPPLLSTRVGNAKANAQSSQQVNSSKNRKQFFRKNLHSNPFNCGILSKRLHHSYSIYQSRIKQSRC
uniref:Uncharacterized protein n=1 Tax=Opuntia streptacantha TaxID=393608 RepID=A0A7C8YJD4_OPUST